MDRLIWGTTMVIGICVQRLCSILLLEFLPGFSSVGDLAPHHLADDVKDVGFAILAVTPPSLPDLYFIIAAVSTFFSLSNNTSAASPNPHGSMINHLLFSCGVVWIFCSQMDLISSYPGPDPAALTAVQAPFHATSLFSYSNSFRLSFHAVILTLLMLSWRSYHPAVQTDRRRKLLTSLWMLSMVSIISSRVDYTADVIRGSLLAFGVFFFYLHVRPLPTPSPSSSSSAISTTKQSPAPASSSLVVHRRPSPMLSSSAEISRLRELYLSLMRYAITNTIYEDPPIGRPDVAGTFDRCAREAGLDLPSQAHCRCGGVRLGAIKACIAAILLEDIPGDLIDVGVWRGGEAVYMKAVLKAYNCTDRTVICLGSFRGGRVAPRLRYSLNLLRFLLPISWVHSFLSIVSRAVPGVVPFPKPHKGDKTIDAHLSNLELIEKASVGTDLESVQDVFRRYGVPDHVLFLSGDVAHESTPLQSTRLSLIRIAAGFSEPDTIRLLDRLYPQLSRGGYIIIDDCSAMMPSIDLFRADRDCTEDVTWVDQHCIHWCKS